MILLIKSRVKEHVRQEKSGKLTVVKEHEDGHGAVGRSWESCYGRRTVSGHATVGGMPRLIVTTEGGGSPQLIAPVDLEKEISLDERQHASRIKMQTAAKEVENQEKARRATHDDIDGFADEKTPMGRSKIVEALNTTVQNNGRLIARKNLIKEKIKDGAKVVDRNGERRLVAKDGSFLDQKAISKTGMDYAVYLERARAALSKALAATYARLIGRG